MITIHQAFASIVILPIWPPPSPLPTRPLRPSPAPGSVCIPPSFSSSSYLHLIRISSSSYLHLILIFILILSSSHPHLILILSSSHPHLILILILIFILIFILISSSSSSSFHPHLHLRNNMIFILATARRGTMGGVRSCDTVWLERPAALYVREWG